MSILSRRLLAVAAIVGAMSTVGCASLELELSLGDPAWSDTELRLWDQAIDREKASDWTGAKTYYRQLLAEHPREPVVIHRLGVVATHLGQYTDAERYLTQALKQRPNDPDLHNDLGYLAFLQRDFAGAEQHYRESLALSPQHDRAASNLNVLLAQHDGSTPASAPASTPAAVARQQPAPAKVAAPGNAVETSDRPIMLATAAAGSAASTSTNTSRRIDQAPAWWDVEPVHPARPDATSTAIGEIELVDHAVLLPEDDLPPSPIDSAPAPLAQTDSLPPTPLAPAPPPAEPPPAPQSDLAPAFPSELPPAPQTELPPAPQPANAIASTPAGSPASSSSDLPPAPELLVVNTPVAAPAAPAAPATTATTPPMAAASAIEAPSARPVNVWPVIRPKAVLTTSVTPTERASTTATFESDELDSSTPSGALPVSGILTPPALVPPDEDVDNEAAALPRIIPGLAPPTLPRPEPARPHVVAESNVASPAPGAPQLLPALLGQAEPAIAALPLPAHAVRVTASVPPLGLVRPTDHLDLPPSPAPEVASVSAPASAPVVAPIVALGANTFAKAPSSAAPPNTSPMTLVTEAELPPLPGFVQADHSPVVVAPASPAILPASTPAAATAPVETRSARGRTPTPARAALPVKSAVVPSEIVPVSATSDDLPPSPAEYTAPRPLHRHGPPTAPSLTAPSATPEDEFVRPLIRRESPRATEPLSQSLSRAADVDSSLAILSDSSAPPAARPAASPAIDEDAAGNALLERYRQQIAARRGEGPLHGLCPVALRDDRALVDGRREYPVRHEGLEYWCSSNDARNRFLACPAAYAPMHAGADAVAGAAGNAVRGDLEFASWYGRRLYLFGSLEHLTRFMHSPSSYARR